MADLTKETRNALPDSHFGVPGKRALPMHDRIHVKLAWDMVDRTKGLTPEERKEARARILHRAKELGVDTADWQRVKASFAAVELHIEAFSGHPNKVPFTGILTRIDEPSDNPLGGTNGKRVIIPHAVALKALPSLVDMAVDFTASFDGHNPQQKIGLIKEAWIEGNAIHISGFFYGTDFPVEVKAIQAKKDEMGFSYEAQALVRSLDDDPLVVEHCVFTGAAVLYKDKAAYESTSLVANKGAPGSDDEVYEMDAKELKEAIAAGISAAIDPIKAQMAEFDKKINVQAKSMHEMVKPHADALRACATAMSAAGIGNHPAQGHAVVLNKMADDLEAASFHGRLADSVGGYMYGAAALNAAASDEAKKAAEDAAKQTTDLKASVADLTTLVKDLKAQAFSAAGETAQRKTISSNVSAALKRAGIAMPGEGEKLSVGAIDAAFEKVPGILTSQKMAVKMELNAAGLLQ